MKAFFLPALLLSVMLLIWLAARSRGSGPRLLGDAVSLCLASLPLALAGVSPLMTGGDVPMGPEGHWLRTAGLLWWLFAARLAASLVRRVLERDALSREARITGDLASGVIYLATFLMILSFVLLLPVGGLVATSGVVAVVIGLALQNTLSDVFSGIAVGIERPFKAGDRISLADGVEGVVIEINWRSVRVQTDGEDIAIIPNSVVAKAQILNRSVPSRRRSARTLVTCPAHMRSESVLELLRRAAMLCPGILAETTPFVSMVRLGAQTSTFAVDFFVADSLAVGRVRTDLLMHAQRQLRYAVLSGMLSTADSHEQRGAHGILAEMALFAQLSVDQKKRMSERMEHRRFRSGEILFEKGGEADRLVVIASGVVEVTGTAAELPSRVLRRAGPGEVIGDIGLVAGATRAFTARAVTPLVVYLLARDHLLDEIHDDEDLGMALETSVSDHVALLDAGVGQVADGKEQLPNFLELLKRRFGSAASRRTSDEGASH